MDSSPPLDTSQGPGGFLGIGGWECFSKPPTPNGSIGLSASFGQNLKKGTLIRGRCTSFIQGFSYCGGCFFHGGLRLRDRGFLIRSGVVCVPLCIITSTSHQPPASQAFMPGLQPHINRQPSQEQQMGTFLCNKNAKTISPE